MRMRTRLGFALTVLIGATVAAPHAYSAPDLPDVGPTHPFAEEIEWLVDHAITTGYDDGTFRPSTHVTRQAMAAFMYRLAGSPALPGSTTVTFSDVSSGAGAGERHPFYDEIMWMAHEGITTGYDDSTFRPAAPVTRQAMAAFMYRLAGEPTAAGPTPVTFADVQPGGTNAPYANPFFEAIRWMGAYEISTGYRVAGTAEVVVYQPQARVSRQAMAAFMKRLAPLLNELWSTSYVAECSDGIDNDGDGHTDYPSDPDCWGALDNSEAAPLDDTPSVFGNPSGGASIPAVARQVNTSNADTVVGHGTPASCTSTALANAVRGGGIITFDCGPAPHTIALNQTLYTCNTHNCKHSWQGGITVTQMVLDGGGLITLDGRDSRGIFYANTCQESFGWLPSSCQKETTPRFVFQNISFTGGNATTVASRHVGVGGGGGGGAIAIRGGQLIVNNASFTHNRCVAKHSDAGGGAIRITSMVSTSYVVNTTIDSNRCANGGGISTLHASIQVLNSVITNNRATGVGANDGNGGNGGGMYGDGNRYTYLIDGSIISGNRAPEGGPGIFYVSNNRTGTLTIRNSQIVNNTGQRFYTAPYRNIFYLGSGQIRVSNSTID